MDVRFSVLTPTRGRPESFALLCKWIARSRFNGLGEWIILYEGPLAEIDCSKMLSKWRVRPIAIPGPDRLVCEKYFAGYDYASADTVVFLEDDEWYAPDYLERVVSAVEEPDALIAGVIYFRTWVVWRRAYHEGSPKQPWGTTLCRTALRGNDMKCRHRYYLEGAMRRRGAGSCDTKLWCTTPIDQKRFLKDRNLCVSFKGVPGVVRLNTRGIHPRDIDTWRDVEKEDTDGRKLREWIGDEDAARYLEIFRGPR